MPTEMETKVLRLLSAIEIPLNAGQIIESWGDEAVTVACEAALGDYPGLRTKIRTNAATLVGTMSHPQAREALRLLLKDANTDVRARALRAAGRQKRDDLVPDIGEMLETPGVPELIAAEAVKSLKVIDTPASRGVLQSYVAKTPKALPHRGSHAVTAVIKRLGIE